MTNPMISRCCCVSTIIAAISLLIAHTIDSSRQEVLWGAWITLIVIAAIMSGFAVLSMHYVNDSYLGYVHSRASNVKEKGEGGEQVLPQLKAEEMEAIMLLAKQAPPNHTHALQSPSAGEEEGKDDFHSC